MHKQQQVFSEEHNVIFMPDEEVRTIRRIFEKMELVQQELSFVANGMKIIENSME